ncbi:hypothetical protein JT167_04340 [Helicobacter pylori]|nr:hypothetical protein [Helicobacter pylori]
MSAMFSSSNFLFWRFKSSIALLKRQFCKSSSLLSVCDAISSSLSVDSALIFSISSAFALVRFCFSFDNSAFSFFKTY